MFNNIWVALFLAASQAAWVSLTMGADPPAFTAQQQVLEQFVGNWRTSYKVPKSEWTAKERTGEADLTTGRVVGGRFIQEKSEHSDSSSGSAIITYDEQRKCYRSWWFSSAGKSSESSGNWDANSRTMTWISSQDAMTSTTQHRFVDDDNAQWNVAVRDPRGKVFFRMEGTSVRTQVGK